SMVILIYYTYIESWTLGFSIFSISQLYFGETTAESMRAFLYSYQGRETSESFTSILPAYGLMILTSFINFYVLYKGISKGIEKLAKIALPMLFLFGFILAIRIKIGRASCRERW